MVSSAMKVSTPMARFERRSVRFCGQFGWDQIEKCSDAGWWVDPDAGDRTFFHVYSAAGGAEKKLDELRKIWLVAHDGDAFEFPKTGNFRKGRLGSHAAGEPSLDYRSRHSACLAEFIRRLAGADERTGEHDLRKMSGLFQQFPCSARLLAAAFKEFPGIVAAGIVVFGLAVA